MKFSVVFLLAPQTRGGASSSTALRFFTTARHVLLLMDGVDESVDDLEESVDDLDEVMDEFDENKTPLNTAAMPHLALS